MVQTFQSPASVAKLLLSPCGSIGRIVFALGAALLALFSLAVDGAVLTAADQDGLMPFGFALAVAWSAGCLSRKRLHDLGWSGLVIANFLAVYIVVVIAAAALPLVLAGTGRLAGLLAFGLAAAPAVGWVAWLTIMPGELAREAQKGTEARPIRA